jgi:predicted RNA binding protein YcfA (HicA-like mRNA interferase family)
MDRLLDISELRRAFSRRGRFVLILTRYRMKFSELIRLLERNGFTLLREKGSIRYYSKPGHDKVLRVDYHGSKEIPTKAAGIRETR